MGTLWWLDGPHVDGIDVLRVGEPPDGRGDGIGEHRLDQVLDPLPPFYLKELGELVLAKSRVRDIRSRNSKRSRGQQFFDQHDLADPFLSRSRIFMKGILIFEKINVIFVVCTLDLR